MKYLLKKLVSTLLTVLVVSILVFVAFSVIPSDAAISKLGTSATPEKIEALREEMGLNDPLHIRYAEWLMGFFTGDMGVSYSYDMPVSELILDKLPITLWLTALSFVMIVVISIPVGIYATKHEGSVVDRTIYVWNQAMMAIPPFFAGILITVLFGMIFRFFTPGGYVSYSKDFGAFIGYLVFPAFAIAIPKAAMTAKLLRNSVLREKKADYVRTAYSRGNSTSQVLYKHIMQNAMIPVVTFLGMTLADIFTGSIIMEQVFNIPGIGRILLTSIGNRDYPVVMAIIVWMAIGVIVINFIVDCIYHLIDPRIRVE